MKENMLCEDCHVRKGGLLQKCPASGEEAFREKCTTPKKVPRENV